MPLGAAKAALLGAAGSGGAEGMEAIAKVVMDGTGVTVSFTSIPQTYRHLRIVMANGRRDSSGNLGMYLVFNSNTTVGDYGGWLQMNAGPSVTRADHYWPPYGDIPSTTNSSGAVWDVPDYANASIGHNTQWQYGADISNSGYRGIGTTNWHPSSSAAITQIDVTSSGSSAGDYLEAPTTFTLFGIGTAA
tara:strand:- start:1339 stop:1908 length:570 start_codon:yes stop_codon:yes gene_type:complete